MADYVASKILKSNKNESERLNAEEMFIFTSHANHQFLRLLNEACAAKIFTGNGPKLTQWVSLINMNSGSA